MVEAGKLGDRVFSLEEWIWEEAAWYGGGGGGGRGPGTRLGGMLAALR